MIFGGILAGGSGSRMSSTGLPKQFLDLGGIPILIRTVRRFLALSDFDKIIIAMNAQYMDYAGQLLKDHAVDLDKIILIEGGVSRFESLLCLCRTANEIASDALIVTHDCARPFVSLRILRDNLAKIQYFDMVTTSIPTIDTILISKDGNEGSCVPDRQTIFCDQGPQTFKVGHFLRLVSSLTSADREKYIEAGRLYLEKGFKVGIVAGERINFKMTTKLDMMIGEYLLQQSPNL